MDEPIKSWVAEIINRIAKRLGATGARGELLVVFSGATVGLTAAINQVRRLILDGYRIRTVFSDNAQNLIGFWIDDQLLGFPFVRKLSGPDWYSALNETRAVVVPALSLNTAAKVSSLIGDTLPTTLMLHALAASKPLIVAVNGTNPDNRHWGGSDPGPTPAFRRAALLRLKTLEDYGCRLTDVNRLHAEVKRVLFASEPRPPALAQTGAPIETANRVLDVGQRIVTAAHICQARDRGMALRLVKGAIVTPLAQDMAMSAGVKLIQSKKG